jgi:hypothetical protein
MIKSLKKLTNNRIIVQYIVALFLIAIPTITFALTSDQVD